MRAGVWVLHVALPVLLLWLLLARPELDLRWDDKLAHLVLVGAAALIAVGLGQRMSREARSREDARLLLVALAFLVSAGFLGLHALATPGVLVADANAAFTVATPVGLLLGGVFALASAVVQRFDRMAALVLQWRRWLHGGITVLLLGWAIVSVAQVPPLDRELGSATAGVVLTALALVGTSAYALSALGYLQLHRRRGTVMLLSVLTAFVLLAEAMIAIAVGRTWQASWWEWHLLIGIAYGFIAYGAHVQYHREGTTRGIFDSVALEQTLADIRRDYTVALEEMVAAIDQRDGGPTRDFGPAAARLADRFELSDQQVAVLERAALALGRERDQGRRLEALVASGRHASVIRDEDDLLDRLLATAAAGFQREQLRLGLVHDGELSFRDGHPPRDAALLARAWDAGEATASGDETTLVVPITVKGSPAAVLEAHRDRGSFDEVDRALLGSFATQLGIALENTRLYGQLDGLFRSYLSPDVATALLADPEQAQLGGATREVTVLMADLQGFTSFAERSAPDEVVTMLNAYYGAVVPHLLGEGGTVVQFVGDAVMAIFNAPVRQADHALRAARAGLRLQAAAARVADGHDDWPRFRVGINTGPALVGNIGADQMRNFTAIGDTTNLAARLEGLADPGQVVVGPVTCEHLGERARLRSDGAVAVKGKRDPIPVHTLLSLS